jgi:hypothetical protein
MEKKIVYDTRHGESKIKRLLPFHKAAFLHAIFYRILVIVSLLTFIVFWLSLAFPLLSQWIRYLIVLVWILFIPQVFSLSEGLAMMRSRGVAFGHLNESFVSAIPKKETYELYKLFPYFISFLWIVALGLFIFEEFL